MEERYDCIIIGSGPAGLSAAIYGKRAGLNLLVLEKGFLPGGQIASTYEVDNYPGMPGISGADLGEAMGDHMEKAGAVSRRETVKSLETEEVTGDKILVTNKNIYRTKTLILAPGAKHRQLNIPGEEELSGMGVSYCATCDGAFFRERVTAVIGGGNSAVEDALFLARVCTKVYLVHRRDELRADKVLQDALKACDNVEILWNYVPKAIGGQDQVETLELESTKGAEGKILDVDGVFIAVGITPNTEFVKEFVDLDQGGYIKAGEDCLTSVPGVYAAGDVRTKRLRQVVTAVADGANAVFSAQEYLTKSGR